MQRSPLFSPDGMNMAGGTTVGATVRSVSTEAAHLVRTLRERMAIVLPHERDDDGLTHNHDWASMANAGPARPDMRHASPLRHLMEVVLPHDRHDDGLVHGHTWATTAA